MPRVSESLSECLNDSANLSASQSVNRPCSQLASLSVSRCQCLRQCQCQDQWYDQSPRQAQCQAKRDGHRDSPSSGRCQSRCQRHGRHQRQCQSQGKGQTQSQHIIKVRTIVNCRTRIIISVESEQASVSNSRGDTPPRLGVFLCTRTLPLSASFPSLSCGKVHQLAQAFQGAEVRGVLGNLISEEYNSCSLFVSFSLVQSFARTSRRRR